MADGFINTLPVLVECSFGLKDTADNWLSVKPC